MTVRIFSLGLGHYRLALAIWAYMPPNLYSWIPEIERCSNIQNIPIYGLAQK